MDLVSKIREEFNKTTDKVEKEVDFFKVLEMIVYRFINKEKCILTKGIYVNINNYLNKYEFENNAGLCTDNRVIRPDIITNLYYKIFYTNKEENKGVVYTTEEYAKLFTKELFEHYVYKKINEDNLDNLDNEKKNLLKETIIACKILDLGCGTGNLIVNMINNIYEVVKDSGIDIDLLQIMKNCTAIDIDEMAIKLLKIRMALCLHENNEANFICFRNINTIIDSLKDIKNIHTEDVLTKYHDIDDRKYNIIVSNPPYGKITDIEDIITEYKIKEKGDFDITYLFMAKMFNYIKYNGIIGAITDRKYLQNNKAKFIRKKIYEKYSILSIKTEKTDIYNKRIQALPIVSMFKYEEDKITFNKKEYFNKNIIFDLQNKYVIRLINNDCISVDMKIRTVRNTLEQYYNVGKGKAKSGSGIKAKYIDRYIVRGRKYNFKCKIDTAIIIIPTWCEINRFAAVGEEYKNKIEEATIYMEEIDKGKIDIRLIISILNSKLIYFWLLVNGKYSTKEKLRVTVEIVKNTPIILDNIDINKRIIEAFDEYISKNNNDALEKINNEVYDLYKITDKEKKIIEEYIDNYKTNKK